MKNREKILFMYAAAFALCCLHAEAQTPQRIPPIRDLIIIDTSGTLPPEIPDYYSGKSMIYGNGFTFKNIEVDEDFIKIGNINNVKFGTDPYLYPPPPVDGVEQIISHLPMFARINDINQVKNSIKDALGVAVVSQFKSANNEAGMDITFVVNMNGTVAEVRFIFDKDPLLLSILPEKFYLLELLLKQRVTFTVRQVVYLKYIPDVVVHVKIKDL